MTEQSTPPYDSLSYEEARDRLSEIVNELDGGGKTLEESLNLWEQGEALVKRCEELLDNAERRLDAEAKDNPRQEEPE